jgi:aminopeptidase
MTDTRYEKLAGVLVGHSTALKAGERVFIEVSDVPDGMVIAIIRAVRKVGALPFVQIQHSRIAREMAREAVKDQVALTAEFELARMKKTDAYIAIRGSENTNEMSDVPGDRLKMIAATMRPVMLHRINKTRWVVLRWPSPSMAQQAQMSTEAFEDYYFRVCTLDYGKLRKGMENLKALMDATDRVHIKGPDTDLRFSIKGIGGVICGGNHNIPDGEVFTAPVKRSVEGQVRYNCPSIYHGTTFEDVSLEFRGGRIIEASAGRNTARLNSILDADAGARFIGEFSLGFNPHILHPIRDILFDEKIAGSFHFTPGQAYEIGGNGNRSQVHWDMVCIQRADYGGGEVWFDGRLIRKDGIFTLPELKLLNPAREK